MPSDKKIVALSSWKFPVEFDYCQRQLPTGKKARLPVMEKDRYNHTGTSCLPRPGNSLKTFPTVVVSRGSDSLDSSFQARIRWMTPRARPNETSAKDFGSGRNLAF